MAAKYKKRKDGRYLIQVQTGINGDGKPEYKNLYARTIPELEKKEREFRTNLDKGIIIDDEGLTVDKWADKWLELYKSHLQHNTQEMYRIMIDAHVKPVLGKLRLRDLKTHHVQELLNTKLIGGSTRTAEKVKLTLSQMVKQAIINEYIYKDIMLGVTIPKKVKPQKRALSDNEIKYVLSAELPLKEKTFIYLLLYTGIRRGEILALTRGDVDFNKKILIVNKSAYVKGNQFEIKNMPKSEAGFRTIPLSDDVLQIIKEYTKNFNNTILFPSTKGEIMTLTSFRRFWERIIKGIEKQSPNKENLKLFNPKNDITPHIFRHTYATMLYYSEVDVKTAQYLLGHSSVQMTMDIYTHLNETYRDSSADKINKYLLSISKQDKECK